MPRVHLVKKARAAGRPRRCIGCGQEIEVGQSFRTWAIKRAFGGSKYFKHVDCGPVMPWELTHSKVGEIYRAQHDAEQALDNLGDTSNDDLEDAVQSIIDQMAEAVRDIEQEYRDAAEAMGGAGYENEERADVLGSAADELESWSYNGPELPDDPADNQVSECPDCEGTGTMDDTDSTGDTVDCDQCGGSGSVDNSSEVDTEQYEADVEEYREAIIDEAREAINNIELP